MKPPYSVSCLTTEREAYIILGKAISRNWLSHVLLCIVRIAEKAFAESLRFITYPLFMNFAKDPDGLIRYMIAKS